ncbi:MAG TPA: hypothetical protein VIM12_14385 [Noviherbaspirillum sp.]|jgi:type III effector protein AvrRpm1|uniref:hypothetical protein n=1 Tax=Noviherbaspirillum sp. TaxID=1926288 RepID=UPI002F91C87E
MTQQPAAASEANESTTTTEGCVRRPDSEPPLVHQVGGKRPRRLVDATQREIAAADVYREQVLYHVTTSEAKQSIQARGFLGKAKSAGATAELAAQVTMQPGFNRNAGTHHYAFTDTTSAKTFQNANLRTARNPAITRFFRGEIPFENDPDFSSPSARRTPMDVPAGQVLKSRRRPATAEEGEMMRRLLVQRGIDVTGPEGGRLLREVQSDSEDDFSHDESTAKPFWQGIRESGTPHSKEALTKELNASSK